MAEILIVFILIIILIGLLYWLFMSSYSQMFGKYPYKVTSKEKVVALTFDDGPNEPYTSEVVDYLNEKEIKATFFQVGESIKKYPSMTKKIYESGHVIGNHTLSHS